MNHREWKELDLKVKTAAAVTVMNILLTCAKFLLYFFSGSMAILAEAWHSFADIATSGLVFIAVRHSSATAQVDAGENLADSTAPSRKSSSRMEMLVSLGIGTLLTIVAGLLLRKFIYAESLPIRNPLISGLLFLTFSIGSCLVYRFETRIGKKEGSIGLVSDGMHARADMTASLLTGFSLILYSMGLNLDRWVAGLIALFILSFALETLFNVALVCFRRESEHLFKYRSVTIIALLFDRAAVRKAIDAINWFFEARLGNTLITRVISKTVLRLPLIFLILIYLSTCFFIVGVREKAMIERFGRPLNIMEAIGPGLHIKWPWPADRVKKIRASYIEELNIGNISERLSRPLLWTRRHGTEEAFLSGDNSHVPPAEPEA